MVRVEITFVERQARHDCLSIISRSRRTKVQHAGHIDRSGPDSNACRHGDGLCVFDHACHRDDFDVVPDPSSATGVVGPVR